MGSLNGVKGGASLTPQSEIVVGDEQLLSHPVRRGGGFGSSPNLKIIKL